MSINDFVQDQIQKTYNSIMGNLLRFNGDFGDIRHISALHSFGAKLKNGVGDDNGISVDDIREIYISCLDEVSIGYSQPKKRKDKYAEIQIFRAVIFYVHANELFNTQKYNESFEKITNFYECIGASKVFKSANLSSILDADHKYTIASKGGQAKAEKEAERKAPIYQKLEQIWDSGKWDWRGKKTGYVNFANWAIHSEESDGLGHDAIRKHISKYHKSKNTD